MFADNHHCRRDNQTQPNPDGICEAALSNQNPFTVSNCYLEFKFTNPFPVRSSL